MKKNPLLSNLIAVCMAAVIFPGCDTDGDAVPAQMNFDLLSGKWSITKQIDKVWEDGNLIEEQTVEIDMNLNTFEVLGNGKARIVQVFNSMWTEADYQINQADSTMNIVFSFGKDDVDITLKILSLTQNSALMLEEGLYDGLPKQSTITLKKNNGDEPSLTESQIVGSWQIAEFRQFRNGVLQEDEEDNPTGAIIEFLSDNTGTLFMGEGEMPLEWVLIDGSNFAMIGEFDGPGSSDIVLLNVQSYNQSTGELNLLEGQYQYESEGVELHSAEIKLTSVPI